MLNRIQIEGVSLLSPALSLIQCPSARISQIAILPSDLFHGNVNRAVEDSTVQRTVVARYGYLCEPHFAPQASSGIPLFRSLRCVAGEVFVVVVDVRCGSPTFGQCRGFDLEGNTQQIVRAPMELALGYLVISDEATIDERLAYDPVDDWQWLDWQASQPKIAWPESAFTFAPHAIPSRDLYDIPLRLLPVYSRPADASEITKATEIEQARETDRRLPTGYPIADADRPANAPTVSVPYLNPATVASFSTAYSDSSAKRDSAVRPGAATPHAPAVRERILILGSSGQLGRDLLRELAPLGDIIGASRRRTVSGASSSSSQLVAQIEVEMTRPASVRQVIRDLRPTLIVNASALNDHEACEANPRLAQLVNAAAPRLIAEEAALLDIPIIHFCSALAYGGAESRAWSEHDASNPRSQFARTKVLGTESVRSSGASHLILRSHWLYSAHRPHWIGTLIDQAFQQNLVLLPELQFGSPTPTAWLARITARLLQQSRGALRDWLDVHGGLLHATPTGFANQFEVAQQILSEGRRRGWKIVARDVRQLPIASGTALNDVATNCRLDCSRLIHLLGDSVTSWQSALCPELDAHVANQPWQRNISVA